MENEFKLNKKFIRTLVNNKPTFLIMGCCNKCPFFKINSDTKQGSCIKYSDDEQSNIIRYIYKYIFKYLLGKSLYIPGFDINIPDWCELQEKLTSTVDYNVYIKNENNVDEVSILENQSTDLAVISDKYVDYDEFKGRIGLVKNNLYNDFIGINVDKKDNIAEINIPISTSTKTEIEIDNTPKGICSCCGKLQRNVDRNIQLGMCIECWIDYKWNRKIKLKSFMNNFRLKRNIQYIDKIKVVDDLKYKVLQKHE